MVVLVLTIWCLVLFMALRKMFYLVVQNTNVKNTFTDYRNNFENQDKVILISDRGRKNTVIGTGRRVFPLLKKYDSNENTLRAYISDNLSFR